MGELSHLDEKGRARMVDVGAKQDTERLAIARGRVAMQPETLQLIMNGQMPKGDVLAVARIAGVMAAKRTPDLIPLCHPIMIVSAEVDLAPGGDLCSIEIESRVKSSGKTGVEMEALTAATVAALAVYDMCKAVDRAMVVSDVRLVYKAGGKSGEYRREGERT